MLEGIADGSVDVIATDHAPHHYDEKNVEFDRAPFGIVGLETAVSICLDRLVRGGVIRLPRLVELLSVNPARIPLRLAENVKSGFCAVHDWTESTAQLHTWVNDAIRNANRKTHLVENSADPLQRDIVR